MMTNEKFNKRLEIIGSDPLTPGPNIEKILSISWFSDTYFIVASLPPCKI